MDNKTLILGMKDTVKYSIVSLPLIIIFEAWLIASWFFNVEDKESIANVGYFGCYIFLFIATSFLLAYILWARKDLKRYYKQLYISQFIYAICIVLWAVAFTYIGSMYRGRFDYLVYITVITILPLNTYLRPNITITLHLASAAVIYYIASHFDRFFSFATNFTVFNIISISVSWSIYKLRKSSYKRQTELENERNNANVLARKDIATGLYNRTKFTEDSEKLTNGEIPQNLVIGFFDVNGLKKINDKHGHAEGDVIIKSTANFLTEAFSELGTVYRISGDEFAGFLYGTDEQISKATKKFEELTNNFVSKKNSKLSVAYGFASHISNPHLSIDELISCADHAMYENKREHHQKAN